MKLERIFWNLRLWKSGIIINEKEKKYHTFGTKSKIKYPNRRKRQNQYPQYTMICKFIEKNTFIISYFRIIISYIGFRQVIQAHITCLRFILPEPKAREIYNTDRLYEPVLPV